MREFLARFGVSHRVSSAYNPHSNQLAEGAVKSAKRMLEDNTGAQGSPTGIGFDIWEEKSEEINIFPFCGK